MADEKQEMIPDGNDGTNMLTPTEEKDGIDAELDSSKVKFINANGGADAHVDIGEPQDNAFCGLTKEELMKYAEDPYWVRVRWILLILFWVAWLGMLVAAIVIIVVAPKCPPRPDLDWWQKSAVCQVYTRSYKDTNGDGIGDLKGVEKKLDYLYKNNMTAVLLSPVYESPMVDFGYDITNHKAIARQYGTMEDFDDLRAAAHRKDMKIIMDFVPNHTSRNHTWFQWSRQRESNYSDYYIWHEGTNGGPPNNWVSVYGGSAWTYDDTRGEYYLHQFLPEQPDLNLRNPRVQEELESILKFWLDKKVDGFRVANAAYLYESAALESDEGSSDSGGPTDDHSSLDHTLTMFQPETYAQIAAWRAFFDDYEKAHETTGTKLLLMVDVEGTANQTMSFFEYDGKRGADMPMNSNLRKLEQGCNSQCVANLVYNWMSSMPEGHWANWQLGNADTSRVASRLGTDFVNAANMLALLLPGTAVSYYGEEIGMVDAVIPADQHQDILAQIIGEEASRDPERTPMQWSSNEINAGFTNSSNPWLPVNENYHTKNVELQAAQGNSDSNLKVYRQMANLRAEPSFQWGRYEDTQDASHKIFGFVRQAQGFPGYLVAVNFDSLPGTADFHAAHPDVVPREGTLVANTMGSDRQHDFPVDKSLWLDGIYLGPGEGVVFQWDWKHAPENQ